MRFVVYGAGAVGGVIGGRLFQAGHEVTLIARGAHLEAVQDAGLRLQDPHGEVCLPIPAVHHPEQLTWRGDEVALISVKSQHSPQVMNDLAVIAPPSVAVVCAQNGVRNELEAVRRFADVYGVVVNAPTAHLEPGLVQAYSTPVTGILDVGRFPHGVDDTTTALAAAFGQAGFDSRPIPDVARWKWRKLLTNLGNAVEVVCGPGARPGPLVDQAITEGEACLRAAGIDYASTEDDLARRGTLIQPHQVHGGQRRGGSSWQSAARGSTSIETDYLNGEVVLLGRLHAVPVPVNTLLARLSNQIIVTRSQPGGTSVEEFNSLLGHTQQA